ncbi:MAG TPA: acylneuraminate cytidylyltransferase family protein [Coxiellaceae bacterium]|nr:acylneuraminate cytidylyltransferase family protein [Coxiellaceae bacterium]
MTHLIAIIPARADSKRVKHKNIRALAGHPLIAYAIHSARQSQLFDRIIVSTDSSVIAEIALQYGAEVPFLRPLAIATSTSPDIEYLTHLFENITGSYDVFAILRPPNPFRTAQTIHRAWETFQQMPEADSIRAVQLCKEHPGKMWAIDGSYLKPLLPQDHLDVAYHARQYQDLPHVYIQNSALEMAKVSVIKETRSREGKVIVPFFTEGYEGFNIDYEEDFAMAEMLIAKGIVTLPLLSTQV